MIIYINVICICIDFTVDDFADQDIASNTDT